MDLSFNEPKLAALKFIAEALNATMTHTPEVIPYLNELEGHTIELTITPLETPLIIHFSDRQVALSLTTVTPPTTRVRGALTTFIGLLFSRDSALPKNIHIQGDVHCMMSLNKLIHAIHIDWEELLSKAIGDAPAYFVGKQVNSFGAWLKESRDTFLSNMHDYLVDEKAVIPSHFEMQAFYDEVDILKHAVDRLDKKIEIAENDL